MFYDPLALYPGSIVRVLQRICVIQSSERDGSMTISSLCTQGVPFEPAHSPAPNSVGRRRSRAQTPSGSSTSLLLRTFLEEALLGGQVVVTLHSPVDNPVVDQEARNPSPCLASRTNEEPLGVIAERTTSDGYLVRGQGCWFQQKKRKG